MKKTMEKSKLTIKYIQNNDEQFIIDRFSCECGKFYQTFPALYLHFQRAHKIKISTRVEEEACIVQKHKKTRNFLYFYSQVKKQEEDQCQPEIKVQNTFEDFSKPLKDYWERCSSMYLNSIPYPYPYEKQMNQNYGKQGEFMKEFPANFNIFEQNYQNLYQIQEIYDYNCRLLLGSALENNGKGYGPLTVEFNQKTSDLDVNESNHEKNTEKYEVKVETQIHQVKEK